ncbi:hypothetical protein V3N99_13220 [Dermatophilaceae bacterium Soc4.6]
MTDAQHDPGGGDAVLLRAVGALRDEPAEGWAQASERVRQTLRQTSRRARALTVTAADLPDGGDLGPTDRLAVSERVVLDALRRTVSGAAGVAPAAIRLELEPADGGRHLCTGVRLDLVVGYGTALMALTEQLRPAVARTIDDLLGPAHRFVDIEVVDVEPDDPTL